MKAFLGGLATAIDWIGRTILGIELLSNAFDWLAARIPLAETAMRNLVQSMQASGHAFEYRIQALNDLEFAVNRHIGTLQALENQGASDIEMRQAHARTVRELNEAMDGLNLTLCDQTGLIYGGIDALQERTSAWMQAQRRHEKEARLNELLQEQDTLLLALNETQLEHASVTSDLEAIQRKWEQAIKDNCISVSMLEQEMFDLYLRAQYLEDEIYAGEAALRALDPALEDARRSMNELAECTTDANGAFESWDDQDLINTPSDTVSEAADLLASNQDLTQAGTEAIEDAQSAMLELAQSDAIRQIGTTMGESIVDGFTSVDFSAIPDTVDTAAGEAVNAMEAQMGNMGAAVASGLDGINSAVDAGMSGMNSAIDAGMNNMGSNVDAGMSNMNSAVDAGMSAVRATLESQVSASVDIVSQLEPKFRSIGTASTAALGQSITSGAFTVVGNVRSMVTASVNAARQGFQAMNSVGRAAIQGMISGMNSMGGALNAAAQRLAQNAVNQMKRTLQISSPSRAMRRLGNFTMQGFCQGLEQYQRRVQNIMRETACMVQDGLGVAFSAGEIRGNLTLATAGADSNHIHQSRMLEKIHDAIEAGRTIVMDSGELVGATYPHYDAAAGQAITYHNRWGR